jgi:uncharacterized protein YdeI (YjbR/CyaY-like superfamily)
VYVVEVGKQLQVTSRADWRAWLEKNHKKEKEVWLIHYKKHTGKATLTYDDAIEEALCYGWVDGLLRSLDNERYILRYSPRRKKSIWSELNKKRANRMIKQGQMTQAGLAKIREAKKNGEWAKATVRDDPKQIPADLKKVLAANPSARKNFENFPPSSQKQYIWWITEAKKAETRGRRISETVRRSEQNKKPGIN